MANEDKKDFNAMLHDNKDMPKFQIITDEKSIEKYGGNRMYFALYFIPSGLTIKSRRVHDVNKLLGVYKSPLE